MIYWKRIDSNGNTLTVESYSHGLLIPGAIRITKDEFRDFIDRMPEPEKPRDLTAEIDRIWEKLDEIHPDSLWDRVRKVFTGNRG